MLLPRLQSHPQGWLTAGVFGDADDATG
jgi:hypothetical protein